MKRKKKHHEKEATIEEINPMILIRKTDSKDADRGSSNGGKIEYS